MDLVQSTLMRGTQVCEDYFRVCEFFRMALLSFPEFFVARMLDPQNELKSADGWFTA